jgi:hypothetical protein
LGEVKFGAPGCGLRVLGFDFRVSEFQISAVSRAVLD